MWLIEHLPPGEAEDAEAEGREGGIAPAVVFESGRCGVRGGSVRLDDQAEVGPEESTT